MPRCGDLARPPMNRTKVARSRRRNSKASLRCLLSDFISANMKKNTGGGASRKNVVAGRSVSKSNGSRRNSSRRRKDLPRREIDHATQRYADLYDLAPTGYVSFNRSGRIEEINLTAARLFGIPRERLIGMPFMIFVTRNDTDIFLHHLLRCRCSDIRVETELRLKNAAREIIYAQICSTPISASSSNGAVLFQTSIVDLTERKRFEEKIQRSQERYRKLFTLVPVAVCACDPDGLIQEYNRRAVELWGQEPGGVGSAQKFCGSYKIYYPDGRTMPHEKCPMARVLRGEKLEPKDLEIIIQRPDGDRRHVVSAPQVLKDGRGKIVGGINCLYDVTERERAREHLQQAK